MRLIPIGIIVLLIVPILFMSIVNSSVSNNNTYYTLEYSKYSSYLHIGKMGILSAEIYKVSNSTYYGNLSCNDKNTYVNRYTTIYTLVTGSTETINGKICINSSASGNLYVRTTIPQLARIIVISADMEEIVWAGFNESYVHTYSYINGSGEVVLQFINGTSMSNISVGIKQNSSIIQYINLTLTKVSVSSESEYSSSFMLHVQMPRKYSPLSECFLVNGSSFSSSAEGYTVTTAYFYGKLMPAIEWKGLGIGNLNLGLRAPMSGRVNFTTLEFYGINGTTVGYVHSAYINAEYHGIFEDSSFIAGELLIVHIINAPALAKPSLISVIYHQGVPVILGICTNNTVETTANVVIQHQVYVNHAKGLLLMLSLNSSAFYVSVIHSTIVNVTIVKPTAVVVSNVTIQGKSYLAQIVNISASGYVTFNVSKVSNENFVVFEQESNGSLVELNSCDYFVVNGTIVVFTDPASTYLIVYGYTPTSSTSSSPSPSAITSPSPSFSNTEILGIAIVIIILIIAVIMVIARKK
ncbi:hypothetical protein [Acidianus ambivalens]|uniref:Thermopsin n=1 Tax=Acidianus ambivalens TaxID=2283 RepID=A0A650CUJ9_ACIAM|nr:hypothetical protein [Acidianus ambivalens]MQL55965.1 hypothetical protein [Acidianus ambivalens]QGR21478.1 hypothetical protein D1866_05355 [Acidianus ambivalens]